MTDKLDPELARRTGTWVRALLGDARAEAKAARAGDTLTKALGEGINSAGGFLVPSGIGAILDLRDRFGLFRRYAFRPPVQGDNVMWPRSLGNIAASWSGENSAFTETTAQFDNVTATAKKLSIYIRASSELVEDADAALGQWFATEVANAFARKEDEAGFGGDGTSAHGGISGFAKLFVDGNHTAGRVLGASGHNTFLTLDMTDISGLVALLPARALPNAAFYCSQTGFGSTFVRLAAAAGGINVINGEPTFAGFPVRVTAALPTLATSITGQLMIAFGDLRQSSLMAERRGVTVATAMSRYMDSDQIAFRATERVDLINHNVGDNSVAGGIVGLVAP